MLVPEDVVEVHAFGGQELTLLEVARRQAELVVRLRVDDQRAAGVERLQDRSELLRLDVAEREAVDHEEVALFEAQRERARERTLTHLARRAVVVVARARTVRLATTDVV